MIEKGPTTPPKSYQLSLESLQQDHSPIANLSSNGTPSSTDDGPFTQKTLDQYERKRLTFKMWQNTSKSYLKYLLVFGVIWLVIDLVILREIGIDYPLKPWTGLLSASLVILLSLTGLTLNYYSKLRNLCKQKDKAEKSVSPLLVSDNEFSEIDDFYDYSEEDDSSDETKGSEENRAILFKTLSLVVLLAALAIQITTLVFLKITPIVPLEPYMNTSAVLSLERPVLIQIYVQFLFSCLGVAALAVNYCLANKQKLAASDLAQFEKLLYGLTQTMHQDDSSSLI